DSMSRAELLREREAPRVDAQPADDDRAGARLLRGDRAGEALLARSLDDDHLADFHSALQVGPFDAVAERQRQRGKLGGDVIRHAVEHSVWVKVLILAVAAPQRRGDRDRRRTITNGGLVRRPVERVGLIAETEIAAAAIPAVAARKILLERNAVAFLD